MNNAIINRACSPRTNKIRKNTLKRALRRMRGEMKLYVWHNATIKLFHRGGPNSIIWTMADDLNAAYDMVAQEYDVSWEDLNDAGFRVSVYEGDAVAAMEPYLYVKAARPMLPGKRLAWPIQVVRYHNGRMYGSTSRFSFVPQD